MSMVVKNNVSAMNTLNVLNRNSSALTNSLKKVSSGMKINGAGDDASGYAISERMRTQIRGLSQDVANCQNGQSMLKVAEGAVSSSVEILKTLKERAINAANDTNTDEDRAIIQKELDKAIEQVDDNAMVTFNGMTMLDGTREIPSRTVEEHIIKALHTEWIQNTLDLVQNSLGINFRSEDANVKDIYLQFFNDPTSDTLALVANAAPPGGKADGLVLTVNMGHFGSMDVHDLPNVDGKVATGTLDRTIAHELTHAIMASNIAGFNDLPVSIIEGMAELVHGIDDSRTLNPSEVRNDKLTAVMTTSGNPIGLDAYKQGYMALRYMAHQSGNDQNAIKKFISVLTSEGEPALDKAVGYATGGKFSSWSDLADKFVADVTAVGDTETFLKEKCGIIKSNYSTTSFDSSEYDTGAITGLDAGGSRIAKNGHDVVPEGGSTRFWYSPTSSFTNYDGLTVHWNTQGVPASVRLTDNDVTGLYKQDPEYAGTVGNMSLQVGTKANQSIHFGFLNMTAEGLGLQDTKGNKISVATREQAQSAISLFDNSIRKALAQQTTIGALQSRLEYTATNLTTAGENTQAAESTIRDADMAKEMTEYTKNNVLLQSAQSMLAQANQNSSSVLSLLQ